MKGADLNTVLHAATLHGILKSPSDAVGVAQDEHRLGRRTRQIFGSKGKDQCLTRSSDAANNSIALLPSCAQSAPDAGPSLRASGLTDRAPSVRPEAGQFVVCGFRERAAHAAGRTAASTKALRDADKPCAIILTGILQGPRPPTSHP